MNSTSTELCTALLYSVSYQCFKFQVDSFYSLEIMAQTGIESEN